MYSMYLPQMYVEFDNCMYFLNFQLTFLNTRDRRYYILYYMEHNIHIHVSQAVDDLQSVVTYSIHSVPFSSTCLFLELIYSICAVQR